MTKTVIIGAGAMGLAAAHYALKLGHEVEVIEADAVAGGMAAHFDFDGLSIERFYHFICKPDAPTFALMDELRIGHLMRWRTTSMAYFARDRLHKWGDPISLLTTGLLNPIEKLRYGVQMFLTSRRRNFDDLENVSARDWIERGAGASVYEKLWRRLMELKFFQYADDVSAAWIATRIRRVGRSRRSLLQEELGYIEGGSETLITALTASIRAQGGRIRLATPAEQVLTRDGAVTGVRAGGRLFEAQAVISTVPTPFVAGLIPDLPEASKADYHAIRNIGVICVVHKLKQSVSPHFWVNIVDPAIEVPGVIEFSNLRPMPQSVVYVPYYMPTDHPKWRWSDEALIEESFGYLRRINPNLTDSDRLASRVGRLRYAQPLCERGFAARIPPIRTPISGLQVADTCFYYPEDRGVSEGARIAHEMALAIGTDHQPRREPVYI
ncbi:MAG: NAD(P)/FAD-dependent oxidoreductase [Phenylobacterium sp.]|uniref:NAD(P)/FAD-dependent oxidoreductase n=1 Tax=Phenylobacterium sp. TaxID=1871053 RepID=UPI00273504E7|nr:NAD(P)/FAD-dependent oxidoreductase [Phenylobacterium sp.]MDP3175694.1 NAD(P)/FAD-dependent oxidoreductase [Phenylobacterium sp.]